MNTRFSRVHPGKALLAYALTAVFPIASLAQSAASSPAQTTRFATPEEAVQTLNDATAARNSEALRGIFGPDVEQLASGNEIQDEEDLANFARRLAEAAVLVPKGDDRVIIHLGVESHPFAVPLIKEGDKWHFDTAAGVEEILNRRIGENEITAIRVCRGYVVAQLEYFLHDHDGDRVMEYAQRISSSQGKKDGLYWETGDDEPLSPLGALVAQARTGAGARAKSAINEQPKPYRGYLFKILNKQGSDAPGGEHAYVINENMVAGFALVAYPAQWGASGIMTFQVNSHGVVYQKDLGEKTAELVGAMNGFNPDSSWTVVID